MTQEPARGARGVYSVGVDIGGTFTDCAIVDQEGLIVTGKAPSTPADFSDGFFDAIANAAHTMGLTVRELLGRAGRIAHGTTTGLNALLTGRGAKVVLITTVGHSDSIRIMNDRRRALGLSMAEMLDWSISSTSDPIIPSDQVLELQERVDCRGAVVVSLTEAELDRMASAVGQCQPESVAICLLWSFANRTHEAMVRAKLNSVYPGLHVSCSYEVAPRLGVYPRAVTTIMNASLAPLMGVYAERIATRAVDYGFAGEVFFVQNDGGLLPATEAARFPVSTLKSGPVAGVVGTAIVGQRSGDRNIVAADMGGTTFDVGVIRDGEPGRSDENVLMRQQVHLRSVDVESVGAGGGSIAWIDERTDVLRVGPRSAGAHPGPICYGRGGTEVTVTDADLVLGILNPDRPLAGGVKLDYDAAHHALERLGQRLGLDPVRCAAGVVEVVDSLMEDLVRRVTVQRGHDPRDFSLWVYGGAAGAHAGLFSRQLRVRRIVLPLGDTASVWSALGGTLLKQRRDFYTSVYVPPPWDLELIEKELSQLEADAREYAASVGIDRDPYVVSRSANMKYGLQVHEVESAIPTGAVDDDWAKELTTDFERAYETRFGAGTGFSGAGVTLTALRVVLESSGIDQLARDVVSGGRNVRSDERPSGDTRPVFWRELDTWVDTPVLVEGEVICDQVMNGPVIVEYPHTTVVARPGQRLWLESTGNLILELNQESA